MNEASFEIVLDVLAREIDLLRYEVKALEEENEKLRNKALKLDNENATLRAMIKERDKDHE